MPWRAPCWRPADGPVPSTTLAKVLKALDGLLLEPRRDGSFRLLGELPDWYRGFDPCPHDLGRLRPDQALLFLDSFLADAAQFWEDGAGSELGSGPWSENDRLGRPVMLEATAINTESGPALLVRRLGDTYRQRERVMQTAREYGLRHVQLLKEIEKKEILLHCIIHDLSNPLTAIKGALGLLSSGASRRPEATQLIDIALRACDRQEAMVREILDAFSAEAAAMDASTESTAPAPDLAVLAAGLVDAMQPAFARCAVELSLETAAEPLGGWLVRADGPKLERVMANLLENALRHSPPEGGVALGLVEQGDSVLVTVDDRGPGVPADRAATLFQKFVGGGTGGGKAGLGLYFCRIMVESWGGDIGYCARSVGGSRFWFTLLRTQP